MDIWASPHQESALAQDPPLSLPAHTKYNYLFIYIYIHIYIILSLSPSLITLQHKVPTLTLLNSQPPLLTTTTTTTTIEQSNLIK